MENTKKSPPKWLMGALILLVPLCTLIPYLAPSILMGDMMESMGIDYNLAGMSITIMLVLSGLCMFLGSIVVDKIGLRNTIVLSIWLMMLGCLIAFVPGNYVIFMIGRAFSGIGFGMVSTCTMPFLSAWYGGKTQTYLFAAFNAMNGISQALAFALAGPIRNLVGSWKGVFGVYAAYIAVIALLWTFLSKENPAYVEAVKARAVEGKAKSSLGSAVRIKAYWFIIIVNVCMVLCSTAVTTFLPTYLETGLAFDAGTAASAASVMSLVGIGGSLLTGVVAAQTGRRKPILLLSCAVYAVGTFALTWVAAVPPVFAVAIVMGFFYAAFTPMLTNMTTEIPKNPSILSAAFALVNGLPMMLGLVVSPLFGSLSAAMGMAGAWRVFAAIMLFGTLFGIAFVRETGPHAKKQN